MSRKSAEMLEWGGVGAIAFVLAYYISNNKTKIAFPVTVGTMLAYALWKSTAVEDEVKKLEAQRSKLEGKALSDWYEDFYAFVKQNYAHVIGTGTALAATSLTLPSPFRVGLDPRDVTAASSAVSTMAPLGNQWVSTLMTYKGAQAIMYLANLVHPGQPVNVEIGGAIMGNMPLLTQYPRNRPQRSFSTEMSEMSDLILENRSIIEVIERATSPEPGLRLGQF